MERHLFPRHTYSVRLKNGESDYLCSVTVNVPFASADRGVVLYAVRKTHPDRMLDVFGPGDILSVDPAPVVSAAHTIAVPSGITVDNKPLVMYVHHEGAVRITLTRIDRNVTPEATYPNDFMVPSNIYNMDCDGTALRRLFAQAAYEWAYDKFLRGKGPEPVADRISWDDVVGVPAYFMGRYGIKPLDEPEVAMVLTVGIDESPFGHDEKEAGADA